MIINSNVYSLSYIAFSGPGSLQLVLVMIMTSADTDLKGLKAALLTTCTVYYLGPSVSYCCSFLVVSDGLILSICGLMY